MSGEGGAHVREYRKVPAVQFSKITSYSLDRLSGSSEAMNIAIHIIDFMSLPKESGDCVVLLLSHPGLNLLGRYFPPSKANEILLADVSRTRPSYGDVYMIGVEEPESQVKLEAFDVMDLASFIEYAQT